MRRQAHSNLGFVASFLFRFSPRYVGLRCLVKRIKMPIEPMTYLMGTAYGGSFGQKSANDKICGS
jgi:hypothetical protein